MSVVDSVSLSNTDNHGHSPVNTVQETDNPPDNHGHSPVNTVQETDNPPDNHGHSPVNTVQGTDTPPGILTSPNPCSVQGTDMPPVNTVQETDTPPGISTSPNPLGLDLQNESVKRKKSNKVCFQFQNTGNCRFGINCKFQHDQASVRDITKLAQVSKNPNQTDKKSEKVCFSFVKSGNCRFGEKCKFSHTVDPKGTNGDECLDEGTENPGLKLLDGALAEAKASLKGVKKPRVCRYFKKGSCKKGAACNFRHPEKKQDDEKGEIPLATHGGIQDGDVAEKPVPRAKVQIQTFLRLSELTDEDLQRLRQTEIQQLQKRFPDILEMENEGHPSIYRVVVHPTDPDWPFNLTDFQLNVSFPFEYPVEPPLISLPEDQDSPPVILSHMTVATQEWIQAKHEMNKMAGRVELIFRPFLRWFDKNVEKLFTEGARKFKKEVDVEKAGFEFIVNPKDDTKDREPAQPSLPKDAVVISKAKGQQMMEEEEKLAAAISEEEEEEEEDEMSSDEEDTSSTTAKVIYDPPDKDMKGTEVIFQGLKLTEAVASLAVHRLTVIIQCSRCKEHTDVTTPPRRNNLISCGRCKNRQIMTYRPCLVHPTSHVIGFLDLDGCLPFDVNIVTSSVVVGCLTCSHDTNLKGLQPGQSRTMWCEKCHQKMTIQVDSCRFQRLQPAENIGSGPLYTVKPKGPKKQAKDPAIVDMLPLPENGSCKHYKKSFRWLRFPCCGKFYPCDVCHDLGNEDGHEMKYATRMLCGFCAKEQPYSADKPCVRCGSSTTKERTQHWEGGTGCRNRVLMSRSDKQKYAGISKTVSKKAYNKAEATKKGK